MLSDSQIKASLNRFDVELQKEEDVINALVIELNKAKESSKDTALSLLKEFASLLFNNYKTPFVLEKEIVRANLNKDKLIKKMINYPLWKTQKQLSMQKELKHLKESIMIMDSIEYFMEESKNHALRCISAINELIALRAEEVKPFTKKQNLLDAQIDGLKTTVYQSIKTILFTFREIDNSNDLRLSTIEKEFRVFFNSICEIIKARTLTHIEDLSPIIAELNDILDTVTIIQSQIKIVNNDNKLIFNSNMSIYTNESELFFDKFDNQGLKALVKEHIEIN